MSKSMQRGLVAVGVVWVLFAFGLLAPTALKFTIIVLFCALASRIAYLVASRWSD